MFSESRMPEKVAFGFRGGAGYLTSIASLMSGRDKRNIEREQSLGRWVATQRTKRQAETDLLIAFFRLRRGMGYGFRFKDWTDYKVLQSQGIVVALGGGEYQLYKRYTFEAETVDRIIQKPIFALTNIIGTGNYSLDDTTGIVTVNSGDPPTAWSGQFDVPVRFDSDEQEIEIIDRRPDGEYLYSWGNIAVVETAEIS